MHVDAEAGRATPCTRVLEQHDASRRARRRRRRQSRRAARAYVARARCTARCAIGARSTRSRADSPRKPIADPSLARAAVAVALYQLDHTRAPPFAVVDRAVDAAAALVRPRAKALVNALLRRYLRERDALHAQRCERPGRALVASALVDRARARRVTRTTGRRSSRAGNARPPLTLRVERARDDARCARRALRRRLESRATRRARRESSLTPTSRSTRCRVTPRRVLGAGPRARSSLRRCSARPTACACSMRARAPGGKTTHILELADVELIALDSDVARLARDTRQPRRGSGLPDRRASRSSRRCGAPARMVGRATVRPHPRRRSVHGIGRRAPPSRRQMAAPRNRRGARSPRAGALLDGAVAAPRAGRDAALRDLLGVRGRKRGAAWHRLPGAASRCVARIHHLSAPSVHARGGQLLPSLRARATIKTDSSTRSPQGPRRCALRRRHPAARAADRPARHAPSRRHADTPTRPAPLPPRARVARCLRRRGDRVLPRRSDARADTIAVKSAGACASTTATCMLQRRVRPRAHTRRSRKRSKRAFALYFAHRVRARPSRAGTGSTRRSLSTSTTVSRVRTTRSRGSTASRADRSARRSTSLGRGAALHLAASPSRPIARRDSSPRGVRYEAAVRLQPRRQPAAEAVPGERARVARMVSSRVGLVPVVASRREPYHASADARICGLRRALALLVSRASSAIAAVSCSRPRPANTGLFRAAATTAARASTR